MEAMTPQEATRLQILRYQRMTGEERLAVALRLHELACALAREGIRRQYPAASEQEIETLLQRRLQLAAGPMTEQDLLIDCVKLPQQGSFAAQPT
jgi:type II secretory pathway predicted ATPase ExeA